MKNSGALWRSVSLMEVLEHRKEFFVIDDAGLYKRARVQLHAKGVVLRDELYGSDIKTKRQQVCREGEFLVAEIDAKSGGFGLVPHELDGAIVSSHYFLFRIDVSRILPEFLNYCSQSKAFRGQVSAQGSTNYASIRPSDVLSYSVPLPSLDEQRAVVAKLDALERKTRRVEKCLDAIERDAERLLVQRFQEAIENAPLRPMRDVAPLVRREVEIDDGCQYTELGVRSFYKGTFHRRTVFGVDFSWQTLYEIKSGDLVFSNIMAWEKAISIARPEDDACVGNHRMLTCEAVEGVMLPGFLFYYFTTEDGFSKIYAASPGTAARNRTMTARALMDIEVPVPSIDVQQDFVLLQSKILALKSKHAAIRESSAALLPAMLERIFSLEEQSHG